MIDGAQRLLLQKCCGILNEPLEQYDDVFWGDLAAYIVLRRGRMSLNDMLVVILASEVTPSDLLCRVMKCQWLLLEARLSVFSAELAEQQLQELKALIEHFHYIETSIVQMSEQIWLQKIHDTEKELESEQGARMVLASLQQWSAEGKLKLINYYKGLPVQAMAKIVDVGRGSEAEVKLAMSPELARVLAISERQGALTPDESDKSYIQLIVSHMGRDCMTFKLNGVAEKPRCSQFSLQPLEPVEVNLYQHKVMIAPARVLDLSLSYLNLELECQVAFKLGEMIDFSFQIEADRMQGAAWIRSVRQHGDRMVVGLELMSDSGLQRKLQQYIASLQRKIIQEIRQKFSVSS